MSDFRDPMSLHVVTSESSASSREGKTWYRLEYVYLILTFHSENESASLSLS